MAVEPTLSWPTDRPASAAEDPPRRRRIVVTGAAGFLGGALATSLLARGHHVRALSRTGCGIAGVQDVRGDLRCGSHLRRALAGADLVFHVAARVGTDGSWDDFRRDNVGVTDALLRSASANEVSDVVLTSSPSVVFSGSAIDGGDESLPLQPVRWAKHAVTKAEAEQRATALTQVLGLRTIILRPHLVWGPGDRHVLPAMARLLRHRRRLCPNTPPVLVDPTYVADAVRAHVLAGDEASRMPEGTTKAIFVTGGDPVPLWSMATDLVTAALGGAPRRVQLPARLFGALAGRGERDARHSALHSQWFDISRARTELGYAPATSIAAGLAEVAAFHARMESEAVA